MFEHDIYVMLMKYIIYICMLLICHLCYHHHHVSEREIYQFKPWPLGPVLAIRKTISYFAFFFTFGSFTQKSQLLPLFCFVNLWAISAWQLLQLVEDTQLLFFCCMLLKKYRERTTFSFPRVWYKPSSHFSREIFSCYITLQLESNEWPLGGFDELGVLVRLLNGLLLHELRRLVLLDWLLSECAGPLEMPNNPFWVAVPFVCLSTLVTCLSSRTW
jgi:hypothetical protein